MTWRDDLRRVTITVDGKQRNLIGASFRGVPFFVESVEQSGGRRIVVHEFVGSDDPFGEDLGRRARTFRVEAYVVGDDYITQKESLLSALEDGVDVGELVLPFSRKTLRAMCDTVQTRETRQEGRFASFSIEFRETPAQAPTPVAVTDSAAKVSTSADAANAATDAEFTKKYSTTNLPGYALTSAETAIKNAVAELKNTLAPVIQDTQEAASLTAQLALITAEASSLVRDPSNILAKFHGAITTLANTAEAVPDALSKALLTSYATDLGAAVVGTTATRQRELANQTALTSAIRCIFAIEAARLAPAITYATIHDAITMRDQITAVLDEQAEIVGDTAYPALVDLRAQVQLAVPGSSTFASVITATRKEPVPSLLVAYQLYGSVDLEADLIGRNPSSSHPGFMAGDLKALSNG